MCDALRTEMHIFYERSTMRRMRSLLGRLFSPVRSYKARTALSVRASDGRGRFEQLESRTMLAADLTLSGTQTLSGGAYVNVSGDTGRLQHEMTLDVNPANPLNIAGFSHSTVGAVIEADVFYTRDGGVTWDTTRIGDSVDGRTSTERFDPSIAFDAEGNLFVAYGVRNQATFSTELIVARSQDGGETFDHFFEVDAAPGVGNLDKWHIATGPSGPNNAGQAVYIAYSIFDEVGGSDVATVYVAGSNDAGASFTEPKPLSDGTSIEFYTDPAVGPNGELYVAWVDRGAEVIKFDRDLNGLWVEDDPADEFGASTTVLSLNEDIFRTIVPAQPTRGINTAPVLDVDRSGGPYDGRLYLTYVDIATDQTHPNYDIYLLTSDNMGASWSSSATGDLQGNVDDSTGTEFHPWVDVDQTTGSVNVIYYTTDGDQPLNQRVNARLASSIDGGDTFVYTDLSSFTSNETDGSNNDYLEYIGLVVHDGTAHGLWSSRLSADPAATDLEALWASAATTSASNTLTVTGEDVGAQTGAFNDFFTIKLSDVRSDYLEVWWYDPVLMTDTLQFAGKIESVGRIDIDGGAGTNIITIDPGVVAEIGVANITIVNANAPRVVNVLFSRDEGGASIPPESTVDFADEVFGQGVNQLVSIPQGGVNQIEVVFDRPIDPNSISLDSLDLIPLRKQGNRPEPTGFSVAADNMSATWDFDYPGNLGIPSDQYALRLHDTVLSAMGMQLDGEWTNPISTTDTTGRSFTSQPSGDGSQGGDFNFYFTLLGADFNTDNLVNLLDLSILGAKFGFNPADFNDGDANGDGAVNLLDLSVLGAQFGFDWRDLGLLALMNADFDGNNQFDFDDTDDFIVAFSQELDEADLNGDGSWDQIDLDIFGVFRSFVV